MPETGLGIDVFISKRPQFHFCLICKTKSDIKITIAALIIIRAPCSQGGKERKEGVKEGSVEGGERTAPQADSYPNYHEAQNITHGERVMC